MDIQRKRLTYRGIVFLLLMQGILFGVAGCGNGRVVAPSHDDEVEPANNISVFAVVSRLDEVNGEITLRGVNGETELELSYTGGADIKDKYGDIMSISQVKLGSMVDIVYDANRNKLVSLYMSANDMVQRLDEISGAEIDYLEKTVRIDGRVYQMSNSICAFSDNTEIGLDEICSEDQLTVWLYNDLVCSVYVELGHGYVRLSDYASYIGGMVEIGYDVIVPVTEDMLLTVREGKYTLRISKGDDVGTKEVEVLKNQELDLSLADLAIEPKLTGSVLFSVTPADAAVYIDGKRINTEGAVELVYGKHKIYITAEGYQTYSASFNVKYAYKIKEYTLLAEGDSTQSSTTAATTSTTTEKSTSTATTETATTQSSEDDNVKDVANAEGTKTANKVTVAAPSGVTIYFDGEYIGIAPMSFTKVTGSHIITLSMLGYLSKSYTVTFTDDGKDETLKYDDLISITSLIQ
ncbi:MAG: PEGA domain-containing protein [Clostridium sp.]|nr:PEGA domain-containing protein [Clostridium sp.]